MFYYRVTLKYMLTDHYEKKEIGIYSSFEKAKNAIDTLKDKEGFIIKKVTKHIKPKFMDKTFWIDGFDTYLYV